MPAKKKLTKEQQLKQRAAALYVNGPERVRGDWAAVQRLLGVEISASDQEVRQFVEEEGGKPISIVIAEKMVEATVNPTGDVADIPDAAILKDKKTDDEWCRLAKQLEPMVQAVAAGVVMASPAQASTLRHILDRCYGRVQEKQSEKRPASGVVAFPVLGNGGGETICPVCGTQYGIPYCNIEEHKEKK